MEDTYVQACASFFTANSITMVFIFQVISKRVSSIINCVKMSDNKIPSKYSLIFNVRGKFSPVINITRHTCFPLSLLAAVSEINFRSFRLERTFISQVSTKYSLFRSTYSKPSYESQGCIRNCPRGIS